MEKLFANCKSIIAIHSEKKIIETNEQAFREQYGEDVPVKYHPIIRSTKGCYEATKRAIDLAKTQRPITYSTEAETHHQN
jgi:dihydroorotase